MQNSKATGRSTNLRQIGYGATFSYILIIVNTLYTLILAPMILRALGSSVYGVYKTVASLSTALMVMDLGLGSTLMRYISKYRADGQDERIGPFVSMAFGEAAVLCLLVAVASAVIYGFIASIYTDTFTADEILLAKRLFIILSINVIIHIMENVLNGVITGYNNFIFGNGIKLIRLLLRIGLILLVFLRTKNAVTLVLIDLFVTLSVTAAEAVYLFAKYKLRLSMRIGTWEAAVFKESFFYTMLLFLTSVTSQFQGNFSNVIIGAVKGPVQVAVYSFGLTIFAMFMQISTAISGVMLPTVMQKLSQENGIKKLRNIVIRAGRLQFALLGAVVIGFLILGRRFIRLWLGEGYEDVYFLALILMIPALFELCVNVCLAILRAQNMLGFRTLVIFSSALLCLGITLVGARYIGYYAAAIGTAVSFLLGSVITMNIYYKKKFGYNMLKLYASIFSRTWLCLIASGASMLVSSHFIRGGWLGLIANAAVFAFVYALSLLVYGLKPEEKRLWRLRKNEKKLASEEE